MEKLVESLMKEAPAWGAKIVGVLVLMFVAMIVAGWAKRAVQKSLDKREFDKTISKFAANMLRYLILIAAVLGCLGVFGVETTSFAAVIGAAGLAIGLAFQGTLANFASGIMLLIFRPFKVGDVIKVADEVGTVEEIELFTTAMTALDNRRIIVPNASVFGNKIINITHHSERRVDIPVGVSYDADIDETRKALEACVPEIKGVLEDPPPQIFLKELADSSVNWQVRVWCKTEDYWDVWQDTIRVAKKSLEGAKLTIPFPQMDVHIDADVVEALKKRAA